MSETVRIRIPRTIINEGATHVVTVNFRSGKDAAAPTSIRYRIDCLTTKQTVLDWTSVSAAAEVSITTPAAVMQSQSNSRERKQIVVEADNGLSTAIVGYGNWQVQNLQGIT